MIKYELMDPIPFGSDTITEFHIRDEVKASDWRGIPIRAQVHHEDAIILLANLAGQPTQVIDGLSFRDLQVLEGMVIDFLHSGFRSSPSHLHSSPESTPASPTPT